MDIETFKKGKETIKAGWPSDRIIEETEDKLVLKCENGAYLVYRFLKPSGLPQLDELMANKVMFQFTENLADSPYENVSMEIAGKRRPEGRVKEALKELAFRVQIGKVIQ